MNIYKILEKASKLRIAVVGDFIQDKYIFGDVERISPEAPVIVVKATDEKTSWGGAGNVVKNLQNLGVEVDFYFDQNRNIVKTRVMSGNHHLIRIDQETIPQVETNPEWMKDLELIINSKIYDCVVISDYHKGVVTKDLAQMIIKSCAAQNIPVVVDAKKDFEKYKGATVLKCNKKEHLHLLEKASRFPETRAWLGVDYHVVTLGEHGISIYYEEDGEGFDGFKVDVKDVCGAGDTVTAVIAMCIAGAAVDNNDETNILLVSILRGCKLANIAASEVCKHPGVYPITKEDLIKRFED